MDQKEKAQIANPNEESTIFDKILDKSIPANIIYEDDLSIAFRDIAPLAPTHFLVIPKKKDGLTQLSKAKQEHKAILGHLMYTAQKVAHQQGLGETGFRVIVNDGKEGCQSVFHIHLHVIGGKQLGWSGQSAAWNNAATMNKIPKL